MSKEDTDKIDRIDSLKANGSNYMPWAHRMRMLFEDKDLWSVVDVGLPDEPAAPGCSRFVLSREEE